jgi:F420H(2)-dependent quinone reductase
MRVVAAHMRLGLALGRASRMFALLETIGRRSERSRHTPVGDGLLGNSSWLAHSSSEPTDGEVFPWRR